MIAQSLLADGDLLIENNHDNKEYRPLFRQPAAARFHGARAATIRSTPSMLPACRSSYYRRYAVGGFPASLVVICLIGALVALAVFDLADAVAGRNAALFTWAAICFTVPFVPAGWLIYPDTVGALIVAWASLWIWKPVDARLSTSLWRGVALAALPWFHTKFIMFLAIFAAALAFQLRRHLRALMVMSAPIALSLAGWLWFFYVIYGIVDPQAPYGDYMLQLHSKNIPRSLLGLLFDQSSGFVVYSPVYLTRRLAAAGSWFAAAICGISGSCFSPRRWRSSGAPRGCHMVGRVERAGAFSRAADPLPGADDRGRRRGRSFRLGSSALRRLRDGEHRHRVHGGHPARAGSSTAIRTVTRGC